MPARRRMAKPLARPRHREVSRRFGTVPACAESRSVPSAPRLTEVPPVQGAERRPAFSSPVTRWVTPPRRVALRVQATSPPRSQRRPLEPWVPARSTAEARVPAAAPAAHHHSFLAPTRHAARAADASPHCQRGQRTSAEDFRYERRPHARYWGRWLPRAAGSRVATQQTQRVGRLADQTRLHAAP